jgi:hypothetical protein
VRDRQSRSSLTLRGACRSSSAIGSLRWSNQDHFGRRRRWTESAAHPNSAVELTVSMEGFERAQVALDFERSGAPTRWPGGTAKGERESASVDTVGASLGGI